MSDPIKALERELSARADAVNQIQFAVDDAVESGDAENVKSLQADLGAAEALLKSAERRLAKARQGATEEERATRRQANAGAAALVATAAAHDVDLARDVATALNALIAGVKAMHAHGAATQAAVADLIRQLPEKDRRAKWPLAQDAGHFSSTLGVLIENQMQREGMFETLAPHPALRLTRQNLTVGLVESYQSRADKLARATKALAETVNSGI
jgi:hypothetical protein